MSVTDQPERAVGQRLVDVCSDLFSLANAARRTDDQVGEGLSLDREERYAWERLQELLEAALIEAMQAKVPGMDTFDVICRLCGLPTKRSAVLQLGQHLICHTCTDDLTS